MCYSSFSIKHSLMFYCSIFFSAPLYPCRRHPYYPPPVVANHTGVSPSIHQRRYYLDSDGHDDSLAQSPIAVSIPSMGCNFRIY